MDRVTRGYRWLLARRLARLGRKRPEAVAERLLRRWRRTGAATRLDGLERAWQRAAECVRRRGGEERRTPPERILCDASLGGLARWLWAAGCAAEATGEPGAALLERAQETGAALLTSDAEIVDRRAVASGEVRAVWVPVHREAPEQLALVFEELGLRRGEPRCMRCGGVLLGVDKAAVAARIPPRTARWLDEYQVCCDCDGLFWRGTHWRRIAARLPS